MGTGFGSGVAAGIRVARRHVGVFPTGVPPHPLFAGAIFGGVDCGWRHRSPTDVAEFLVDDALSPPPASSVARTTKEVLEKLVDGDSAALDLLSRFQAAVRPKPAVPDDGQVRKLTEQYRQTCDTLQATEDALRSARQNLVRQRKMHGAATEHLQPALTTCKSKSPSWCRPRFATTLQRKEGAP